MSKIINSTTTIMIIIHHIFICWCVVLCDVYIHSFIHSNLTDHSLFFTSSSSLSQIPCNNIVTTLHIYIYMCVYVSKHQKGNIYINIYKEEKCTHTHTIVFKMFCSMGITIYGYYLRCLMIKLNLTKICVRKSLNNSNYFF